MISYVRTSAGKIYLGSGSCLTFSHSSFDIFFFLTGCSASCLILEGVDFLLCFGVEPFLEGERPDVDLIGVDVEGRFGLDEGAFGLLEPFAVFAGEVLPFGFSFLAALDRASRPLARSFTQAVPREAWQ